MEPDDCLPLPLRATLSSRPFDLVTSQRADQPRSPENFTTTNPIRSCDQAGLELATVSAAIKLTEQKSRFMLHLPHDMFGKYNITLFPDIWKYRSEIYSITRKYRNGAYLGMTITAVVYQITDEVFCVLKECPVIKLAAITCGSDQSCV